MEMRKHDSKRKRMTRDFKGEALLVIVSLQAVCAVYYVVVPEEDDEVMTAVIVCRRCFR